MITKLTMEITLEDDGSVTEHSEFSAPAKSVILSGMLGIASRTAKSAANSVFEQVHGEERKQCEAKFQELYDAVPDHERTQITDRT